MSATPTEPKTARPWVYRVMPVEGEEDKKWDLHKVRTIKHTHFHTVKEAVAAAHEEAAEHPAHIIIHALDGHAYREYDLS